MINRLFSTTPIFDWSKHAKSPKIAFAIRVIAVIATFFSNGCKPALDPSANRTDYIRILDIGAVVNTPLLSNAQIKSSATPPVRIQMSSDGNLILLSTAIIPFHDTSHFGIQLTKVTLTAKVIWSQIYQDSTADLLGNDFTQLPDGSFLIAATQLKQSSIRATIIKDDQNGNTIWEKQYTTKFSPPECLFSFIVPTGDGNYLVSGSFKNNHPTSPGPAQAFGPLVRVVNADGDSILEIPTDTVIISNSAPVFITDGIIKSPMSGGYLIVGSSPTSNTTSEPVFYQIQPMLNSRITAQAPWPQSHYITINCLSGASNNYVLFGDSLSASGPTFQYAVIYGVPDDQTYLPSWQYYYSYPSSDHNSFTSGITTPDGGYLAAGYTVTRSDTSILVVKIDVNRKKLWSKTYPGTGDQATSVLQAPDGTYIVAGVTTSFGGRGGTNQVFIMRLNANGDYVN